MNIEIDSPGKVLVALSLARTQVGTRYNELTNCPKCSEGLRDSYKQSLATLDALITQIRESLP